MSSEIASFTVSSFTRVDASGRCRLHSRLFAFYSRVFSVVLFMGACDLVWSELAPAARSGAWQDLGKALLVMIAILAMSRYLWLRPKPIFATRTGLEVGSGKRRRLIPWSRVLDVREMPSVRLSTFSNPRMWQVDLDHDERFDFCGTLEAREIVADYIAHAERSK